MPLWLHGDAPTGIYVGDIRARRVYLGDIELWNGDIPVELTLKPARGTGSAPAPTLSAAVIATLPSAAGVGSAPPPSVVAGSGAVLAPAVGVGSAPPPVLSSAVTIPLSTATGIGTAPAPNIGEVVLTLSPALGSGSAPAPSVGGGAAVTLSAAAGVGRAPTPSVAAGVTIALAPATGSGSAPAPDFASGITVTDDFNRADGGLGANWTTIGANAPVIASNRAQAGTPGIGQTLAYIARHNTALTTDTQEVVFVPIAATVGPTPAQGAGAFLRSTSAGNFVCVSVTDTQAFINTYISGTFTNRATSGTISAPTSVRFTAVGNVYSVYINGSATAAVTWTDSGALIGIGSSNRYFGLFSNAVYSFSGGNRGYAIDSIIARDGVTS